MDTEAEDMENGWDCYGDERDQKRKEVLREFDELGEGYIRGARSTKNMTGIKRWISEKLDFAYQQGKADKAREVEEILESKRKNFLSEVAMWRDCKESVQRVRTQCEENNRLIADLKQELNKEKGRRCRLTEK